MLFKVHLFSSSRVVSSSYEFFGRRKKQQTLIAFVKLSGVFCGKQELIRIQAFYCLGETLFREPLSGPSMITNFLANRLEESKSRRRKIPFVKSLLFSSSPFICQSKSGEKDGNCLFLLFLLLQTSDRQQQSSLEEDGKNTRKEKREGKRKAIRY